MLRGFSILLLAFTPLAAQTVVALDGYHNNESKMPDHYQWDGTRPGGFSELAKLLRQNGADELRTLRNRIDTASLEGVKALIVVDPDTPAETVDPKYIEDSEIDAIAQWVSGGGRLVLLGNDKGNAEFEHLNRLAAEPVLVDHGINIMALTRYGKGLVFAAGDPWIYNEYIDHKDNRQIATKLFRLLLSK